MFRDLGFIATIIYTEIAAEMPIHLLVSEDLTISTNNVWISIRCFSNVQIFTDESDEVTVVFYGYLTDDTNLSQIIESYKIEGLQSFKSLDGSFGLLLFDKRHEKIVLVTDRLCSKKLYFRKKKGAMYVSTGLKHIFTDDLSIDPIGLAWYLSNGVVHNNRTIFKEIIRLNRASCYSFFADGSEDLFQYWRYEFTDEYTHKDINWVKEEFSELLIESLKKRVKKDSHLNLSLSAGYDVSGILGILSEYLNADNLYSFSYGMSETDVTGDPYIARRLAEMYGITHQFYKSYDGNLFEAIERNALWGDGHTPFCDEALVWNHLADTIHSQNYPLIVGHQVFGRGGELSSSNKEDVIATLKFLNFSTLYWIKGSLSPGVYKYFIDGQNQDISDFFKKAPQSSNYDDIKDFIYLDNRLCNLVFPWRENFCSRAYVVHNPLLDNALLDFTRKLPGHWRQGKCLYKETIASMLPRLFAIERAKILNLIPDWTAEIIREKTSIKDTYLENGKPSLMDDYIDPYSIVKLLFIKEKTPNKVTSLKKNINSISYYMLRKVIPNEGGKIRRQIRPFITSRTVFLLRYLVLKRFLEIAKEDPILQEKNREEAIPSIRNLN